MQISSALHQSSFLSDPPVSLRPSSRCFSAFELLLSRRPFKQLLFAGMCTKLFFIYQRMNLIVSFLINYMF